MALLVVLLLVGVLAWRVLPFLTQSRFGRFERYNLLVSTQHTSLVSIDSSGKEAVVVVFPDDLYILEVAHGYGQYEISKVYAVGQLDHRGGEVLKQTVSQYLGVPVDGYVRSNRRLDATDLKSFVLSPNFIFKDGSDLGLVDRLKLLQAVLALRFDKIKKVDLGGFVDPLVLADGSKAVFVDKGNLDGILKNLFVEKALSNENLRVEVVNSTSIAGLGGNVARTLTNIGASVVSVESVEPIVSACRLQLSDKVRNSLTAARIEDILHCQKERIGSFSKADLVVVIGQDYADLFTK